MKMVIEFYRIREIDDAHAVVGRETAVAAGLEEAIGIAQRLSHTLDMPQRPDAMAISDAQGTLLYRGLLNAAREPDTGGRR